MTNHLDIVKRVHAADHPTGGPDSNLAFLLRLVAALPAEEAAGLHRKDAGENIAFYALAGVNVGVSRIMYPDGALVKVLSDAGPGGTNAPAWNEEEAIDPDRYVAVIPTESEEDPERQPAPTHPTYDDFINGGDKAYANQIAGALTKYRGSYAPTDLAHFFWKLFTEGVSIEAVVQEIRGTR